MSGLLYKEGPSHYIPLGVPAGHQFMHFPGSVLHRGGTGAHVVCVVGLEHRVAVEARRHRVGEAGGLHQRLARMPEHVRRDEAQAQRLQLGPPQPVQGVVAHGDEARLAPGGDGGGVGRVRARRGDYLQQALAAGDDGGPLADGGIVLGAVDEAVGIGVPPSHDKCQRADLGAGDDVERRLGHDVGGGDAEGLLLAEAGEAEDEVGLQGPAAHGGEGRRGLPGGPRRALGPPRLRGHDAALEGPLVDEAVVVGGAHDGAQGALGEGRGRRREHDGLHPAVAERREGHVPDEGEDVALHLAVVLGERRRAPGRSPVGGSEAEDATVVLLERHRVADRGAGAELRHDPHGGDRCVGLGPVDRARDGTALPVGAAAEARADLPHAGRQLSVASRALRPSLLWHNGAVPSENSVSWDAAPARRSDSARGPFLFTCLLFESGYWPLTTISEPPTVLILLS